MLQIQNAEQQLTEQEAYEYCEETIKLKGKLELGYMTVAQRLWIIKANNLAEHQYGGWDNFLKDIGIDKGVAKQMMYVYKKFVIENRIDPQDVVDAGGYSVMYRVLPLVKDRESALEAIETVKTLRTRELVIKHLNDVKNEGKADCKHEDTYTIEVCDCCGEKWKTGVKGQEQI